MRVFFPSPPVWLRLSACHKAPHTSEAKPPPVVTVRVETIEVKPHPVTEEVIGTVRAKIRAAVEAKVSGRITRMAVDLGQPVREGDLIAEIDAQEIKARLDQAVATREQAGQDLKRYTSCWKTGCSKAGIRHCPGPLSRGRRGGQRGTSDAWLCGSASAICRRDLAPAGGRRGFRVARQTIGRN